MDYHFCPVCGQKMVVWKKWRESKYDFYAECFCKKCLKYFRYEFKNRGWAGYSKGFKEIGKVYTNRG